MVALFMVVTTQTELPSDPTPDKKEKNLRAGELAYVTGLM